MKTPTAAKAETSKMESPKTPGGISKCLLTPCRRVGLSRKWRGSGVSPFVSPLGQNDFNKQDNESEIGVNNTDTETAKTPSRPVRKKCKPLYKTLSSNSKSSMGISEFSEDNNEYIPETKSDDIETTTPLQDTALTDTETLKETPIDNVDASAEIEDTILTGTSVQEHTNNNVQKLTRKKSLKKPNNLTKECMVVIDREILNRNDNNSLKIFDSESDNTPLSHVSKLIDKENTHTDPDENTFVVHLSKKKSDKKTSTGDLRKRQKMNNTSKPFQSFTALIDEDDDDFIEMKRTILLRKSYAKPTRAKSTGSITQKDVDDIKSRIKWKKELLQAKPCSQDIAELQELIKKWRKGCQDALSQLMDLMRKKFPEKHNMDYSELLEMLKIPTSIVGYDPEHDMFKSPNDYHIFGF